VLIHYTPAMAEEILPVYRDLLAALAEDTRVLVAVEARTHADELARRLADGGGARALRPIVVGRAITAWSRDRFATARRGGRPLLLVPPQRVSPVPGRANDWIVPWALSAALNGAVEVAQAPFDFDGGDVVSDERRVYATAVLLERNRGTAFGRAAVARPALAALTGLEPVLVGASAAQVPPHHVCMVLTPIGGGRVLVGDPSMAREVLAASGAALPAGVEPDWSAATQARFDLVAGALARAGVEVSRLPLVPTREELVYLSYNNVLVDDRADGRHVLLPRYGVAALDEAAAAAWRGLGFEVHPIDASRVFRHGGAVRCLVAAVERTGRAPATP